MEKRVLDILSGRNQTSQGLDCSFYGPLIESKTKKTKPHDQNNSKIQSENRRNRQTNL